MLQKGVFLGEGGGPQRHKRACLSIRLLLRLEMGVRGVERDEKVYIRNKRKTDDNKKSERGLDMPGKCCLQINLP